MQQEIGTGMLSFVAGFLLMLLFLVTYANYAHGAQYTCAQVRTAYNTYGAGVLQQWAVEYGATPQQYRAAVACIHGRRIVKRRR